MLGCQDISPIGPFPPAPAACPGSASSHTPPSSTYKLLLALYGRQLPPRHPHLCLRNSKPTFLAHRSFAVAPDVRSTTEDLYHILGYSDHPVCLGVKDSQQHASLEACRHGLGAVPGANRRCSAAALPQGQRDRDRYRQGSDSTIASTGRRRKQELWLHQDSVGRDDNSICGDKHQVGGHDDGICGDKHQVGGNDDGLGVSIYCDSLGVSIYVSYTSKVSKPITKLTRGRITVTDTATATATNHVTSVIVSGTTATDWATKTDVTTDWATVTSIETSIWLSVSPVPRNVLIHANFASPIRLPGPSAHAPLGLMSSELRITSRRLTV